MPPPPPHERLPSPPGFGSPPAGPAPDGRVPKSFRCRPELWARFEAIAERLDCPVDELLCDAMTRYVRDHVGRTPMPGLSPSGAAPSPRLAGPPAAQLATPASAPSRTPPARMPPPLPPTAHPGPPQPPPLARPGSLPEPRLPSHGPLAPPPAFPGHGALAPPPAARPFLESAPPHAPGERAGSGPRAVPGPPRPLQVEYQGQRTPVTKDRFVIGRGKKTADLAIADPNVSRQHALVEFVDGVPFLVDLGSTNGVEFGGQAIARKRIDEGDVFVVGGHVITFTFR